MEQEVSKSAFNNIFKDGDAQFYNDHEESLFVDALDSFESDDSLCVSEPSSISDVDNININNCVASSVQSKETSESPYSSFSADRCRRRLVPQLSSREFSPSHSFTTKSNSLLDFDSHGSTISQGKDCKISWNVKDNEKSKNKLNSTRISVNSRSVRKLLNEATNDDSAIMNANDDERTNDESITVDSPHHGSNFLFALARLWIKVTGFQINLLVSFVTFPMWLVYSSYMFVIDPFRIMRRAKCYMLGNFSRFWGFCYGYVKWIVYMWIKKHESTWKLCLRIWWGLLWSAYVGLILISLLVSAFVICGIILKCILEGPIQMTEQLNFDYTRDSPTAFVPIMSCPDPSFLEYSKHSHGCTDEPRLIPLDHKVHATVSLTLPESYYNRNLGVFQVRVDFLSDRGKPLASSIQPCMLHFRSQPIRLLLTFLKLVPLITGYSSESQTLNVKFRGYTERNIPTSCLRVTMEQRAEFSRGGGVPEIYAASLKLESQPPLLKRILWSWKGTIYVWASITMFMIELLFALLCCTPIMAPWLCPRGVSSSNNASRNTRAGPK